MLATWGFSLLYHARTGESILTPWQTIPSSYIYVFFAATFLLGLLIFSSLRTGTILFLLMAHTLLLHSYLPLTHEFFYGADGWRHVANEVRLVEEKPFLEAKLSEEIGNKKQDIGYWKLDIGKLSYGNFWGVSVILSRLLSLDLLPLNKWFMPILWSLFLPLLLFEFGGLLNFGKRGSLLLSWLGFLPFAWQAGGAFTLPVNSGFLSWLLFVILILKRLNHPLTPSFVRRGQVMILSAIGLLSFFGYALYALLFWLAWGVGETVRLKIKDKRLKIVMLIVAAGVGAITIPAVEVLAGYSQIPTTINWLGQVRQLFGNFTGWYLAAGPRPHDITAGNIIFNQVPSYAFVGNVFTVWRWWLVDFMVLLIVAVHVGLAISLRKKEAVYTWLAVIWTSVMVSYIIGRYILVGEQIFSRRLDNVIALFFVVLSAVFLNWLFVKSPIAGGRRGVLVSPARAALFFCFFVFLFSCGITTSYSLGPDTSTVSADEYKAMQYVWSQEKGNQNHCVIADTMPLLALEAISQKEIIGGGFPINQYFAQPEREKIFEQIKMGSQKEIDSARRVTGADYCWVYINNSLRKL